MKPGRARAPSVLLLAAGLLAGACGSQTTAQPADAGPDPAIQAAGQRLALSCTGCHGGSSDAIPHLYDLTQEEMQSRLTAYQSDPDGTTVMHRLMRGYSAEEIAALSAYLAPGPEEK